MHAGASGENDFTSSEERQGQHLRSAQLETLVGRVRDAIRPEDIKPPFRRLDRPMAGACYVASEAIYHLSGGADSGLKPMRIKHEGVSHWWLVDADDTVVDATADQFDTAVPYADGVGSGFLTKQPSKRAQVLIERMHGQD